MTTRAWWERRCGLCTHLAALFGLFCLFSVPWCIWLWYGWMNDTAPVVEYGPGSVDQAHVRHGDTLTVFQPVKKLRECDGVIRRVIAGACGHYVVWEGPSSLVKDFAGRLVLPVRIPFELIPGQCSFKIYARYYCNPLDRFLERQVYESPAVEFMVKGIEP